MKCSMTTITSRLTVIAIDLPRGVLARERQPAYLLALNGAAMHRAEPRTYVTDLTHFDGALDPGSNAPAPAKRLAKFFDEVVRVASREALGTIRTDVRCFKKPARRPCSGRIVATRSQSREEISWECPSCGNNGVIHNWRGTKADLSRCARPESKLQKKRTGSEKMFEGTWRITEMEQWEHDAIDLLGPGFFRFDQEQSGQFQFIAVRGWLDCRYAERDGQPLVEFTWEGDDEGTEASGRGWAVVDQHGGLNGRIFFHRGDDSSFTAIRSKSMTLQ